MLAKNFWAKKSDRDGTLKWLSVIDHLQDTAGIIGRLWELWLDDSQKKMITENLISEEDGKKLATFIAYVHDIGKVTANFVTKKSFTNSEDLDSEVLIKLERCGFKGIHNLELANANKSHHSIAGQVMLEKFGVKRDVSSIVGSHHGKSVNSLEDIELQLSSYSANYYGEENCSSDNLFKKAQEELFNWALKKSGYSSVEDIPEISVPVQMILTGLLIMADWIASNEYYFPLIPIDDESACNPQVRIIDGFNKWRMSDTWIAEDVYEASKIYEKRFGFNTPRYEQQVLFDVIEQIDEPGIIIFEAPMGMGKTEASLIAAEQLACKLGKSGLFFGLPTQATSDGIFPRINDKWLKSISEDMGEKLPIRLKHGKSSLNDIYRHLSRNIYEDDFTPGTFVNEWFSGNKTSALDDFIVGTVDNFLMMSLKQKHLFLRHLGFSKKVVIIDEVHSYDSFMASYLYQSIKWAATYNIPIIILSATLPSERRKELVKNYLIGKGVKNIEIKKQLSSLNTDSYPLITYTDGEEVRIFDEFKTKHSKTIEIIREDSENLLNLVEDFSKEGGVIGIVVNTVKKSQEIAKDLIFKFGEENVELLHSSFIATDRIKKEKNLMKIIGGKIEDRPKFKIIIGTQVIEQSLDIDFDVMISDLAPMDLLIQRMGRLHRHKNIRPEIFKEPKFYVLGTSDVLDFEKGSIAVYDGYNLTRTQYFLPDKINIPEDISPLVQNVYGESEIELKEELLPIYKDYKDKFEAYTKNKTKRAETFKLREPYERSRFTDVNNLIGMFSTSKDFSGKSEEQIYAQVRDIKETVEVIALKKLDEGYGVFGDELDLSKDLENIETLREISKHTLRIPSGLTFSSAQVDRLILNLENYNNKYLRNWQDKSFLKGCLGIIFDKEGEFLLDGVRLKYDEKLGLMYERM